MIRRPFHAVVPAVSEAVAWVGALAEEAGVPTERGLEVELAVEEALIENDENEIEIDEVEIEIDEIDTDDTTGASEALETTEA